MLISTNANIVVSKPIKEVFDFVHDVNNAPKLMTGWGKVIAGIDRMEWVDGDKPYAGARRRVFILDGTVMLEEVREFKPPNLMRYRLLGGLPTHVAAMIKYTDADWRFEQLDDATSVTWTYNVKARNPLVLPGLVPFVKVPVRQAMRKTLANIRTELEK